VINTDAHMTRVVGEWRYGIRQLRRAWLTASDVVNTLAAGEFVGSLRKR
jgi:DNA polymerase (family X)